MKQDSVVKQINRINSSSASGSRDRNRNGGYKKKTNSKNRPNESRIAVAGSRNYRRSKTRRKAATGRRRRRSFLSVVAVITAVMVLCGGLGGGIYAIWYNSFTDVNLADYSEVTLSGYDNYGEASLDVVGDTEHKDFFNTVSATLDETQNLSNGDEITVSYIYDEKLAKEQKLRITDKEEKITVAGLQEAKVIDHNALFSGLSLEFDGMTPCIGVSLVNTSEDSFLAGVTYSIVGDKKYFSGGDEVRIQATVDESAITDHSYVLDLSEEDYFNVYTAPFGDSYLSDANQISEENLTELEQAGFQLISRADAKEYGLRIFQQEAHLQPVFVGNTTTFKWVNPYVISAYFHSVTEAGKDIPESHANDVQIVYGVTLTQQDGQSVLAEMVIQFVNLVEKEDGTKDLNLSSGRIVSASYRNSNIKKLVSGDDGVYFTTKLTD